VSDIERVSVLTRLRVERIATRQRALVSLLDDIEKLLTASPGPASASPGHGANKAVASPGQDGAAKRVTGTCPVYEARRAADRAKHRRQRAKRSQAEASP
jgi:hypothetical protein